jgi:hypothetical protein
MAALVSALDSSTPIQSSEKGHAEYAWSNSVRERILQFSFQTTRTTADGVEKLAQILRQILRDLQGGLKTGTLCPGEHQELLITAYKIIGHTRDIIDGKGEYAHAYMQLLVWYEFHPVLALFALEKFVTFEDNAHPYGSWKDIKYFCNYCKVKGVSVEHPLMQYAFSLLNAQILRDSSNNNSNSNSNSKTLAAKWAAREKCKRFGWIFEQLAYSYFEHYLATAKNPEGLKKAQKKCKMDFRKLCSGLNKQLGTTQVYQCDKRWAEIDHAKTTSITISKQKQAFLNVKKDGTQRTEDPDRIQCAENFKARIKKAVAGEVEIKGKRVGLNDFVVQALDIIRRKQVYKMRTIPEDLQAEMDLLNSQWLNNATQTGALCEMIPMCDFSGSMNGDPLNTCFALGIRVAEKSKLGNRVLSFSENPTWHNLDGAATFIDKVEVLQQGEVGYSTQFYKALKVILDAIIDKKLAPDQVSGLVLTIFSDMQIDQAETASGRPAPNMDTLYQTVEAMYAEAGNRVHGAPFKPPHILFWNLRSTGGFPTLSSQKNVSMMSGFSPALLNMFCDKGIDAFANCTPWSVLMESMNKPRYQCLEDKVKEFF